MVELGRDGGWQRLRGRKNVARTATALGLVASLFAACTLHAPPPSTQAAGGTAGSGAATSSQNEAGNGEAPTSNGGSLGTPGGGGKPSQIPSAGGDTSDVATAGAAGDSTSVGGQASTCSPACAPGEKCSAGGSCKCELTTCSSGCVNVETDAKNCGACGSVCDGQCYAGHCRTQLARLVGAGSVQLLVDKKELYFTAWSLGTVNRMPSAGGSIEAIAEAQNLPVGIAVDATNVYWATDDSVMKRARTGQTAAVALVENEHAHDIFVDATNVYWTVGTSPGAVATIPIAGGTRKVLATGVDLKYPTKLATDGTAAYWLNEGSLVNDGSVMKVPLTGGTAVTLATGYELPQDVVTFGGEVYFSLLVGVRKVSAAGGVSTVSAAPQGATPLAVDASGIYCRVVGMGRDEVARLSLDGKTITPLAETPAPPTGIAVDATTVYWATREGIYSVPK